MLRVQDLDSAVELGIMDESTRLKIQDAVMATSEPRGSSLENEIYKLKDVIICLTKELLVKDEKIKQLESSCRVIRQDYDDVVRDYYGLKGDISVLEQIIDKLKTQK